jgi:hypothetical protein
MRIIINHLTRMRPGYICVAGLSEETFEAIRPILRYGQLPRELYAGEGGPFDIGRVVDIGPVMMAGRPPETEDRVFDTENAVATGVLTDREFWDLIRTQAVPDLRTIFGKDLRARGRTAAVDPGTGLASLGLIQTQGLPTLEVDGYGSLRIRLTDGTFNVRPSVTDLRLYEADQKTLDADKVNRVKRRIQEGEPAVVAVGLGRAWRTPQDSQPRHWLQANNIHLASGPI